MVLWAWRNSHWFFPKKKKNKKKDLAVRLGGGICGVVVLSALFIPPTLVGRNGRKAGAFRQRFGGSGIMNLLAYFFSFFFFLFLRLRPKSK